MSTVSKRRQKLHFLYAGVFSLLSNFDELYKETRTFVFFAMRLCNGHSTQHAILNIVNDTQTNMNQRFPCCGVFIDLKKPFDIVDHDILLDERNHYGFRGIINDWPWFSSYLKNRTQTTQVSLRRRRQLTPVTTGKFPSATQANASRPSNIR